jgi:hypothetical protein
MYARPTFPFLLSIAVANGRGDPRRGVMSLLPAFVLAYLLVLGAWSAPVEKGSETAAQPEYSVKAAFLYKFLGYVEWGPGTFRAPTSPVVIGLLGGDAISEALAAVVEGRKVGERPVEIRRLRPADSLDGVHMLYVGREHAARMRQIAQLAQRRGVLVVTDYEGALDEGSGINLVVIDNRVRFEVSLDATEKSGLKLSSRLLSIALWVRPAG